MDERLIECVRNKLFGVPSLRGRRLSVYDIVSKIYVEDTLEEALEDYVITLSEAKAATEYCLNLDCQKDKDRLQFCDGCILRTIEDGWEFNKDDYKQIDDKLTISKNGQVIFFGTIKELADEEFGKPGWVIASEIYALMG